LVRKDLSLKNWKYPNDFHMTSLFVGGKKGFTTQIQPNPSKLENYNRFKSNVQFFLSLKGLVYCPGGLFAGVSFVDQKKLLVDNEFPHVTLMLDKLKPVDSNRRSTGVTSWTEWPSH
jgi:hypothetical protein